MQNVKRQSQHNADLIMSPLNRQKVASQGRSVRTSYNVSRAAKFTPQARMSQGFTEVSQGDYEEVNFITSKPTRIT